MCSSDLETGTGAVGINLRPFAGKVVVARGCCKEIKKIK